MLLCKICHSPTRIYFDDISTYHCHTCKITLNNPPCKFCNSNTQNVGISNQCRCTKCNATFGYNDDGTILESYTFIYENFTFRFYLTNNTFELLDFSKSPFLLLEFYYLPDITPKNAPEKLKTLLTFM